MKQFDLQGNEYDIQIRDMIEPIENWQYVSGTRDIGKSYFQNLLDEKDKEIERLNKIIEHIENICKSSIASVDKILQDEKETKFENGRCTNRNGYQIERLKAYRTKSKEILGRIKELKGSDKE